MSRLTIVEQEVFNNNARKMFKEYKKLRPQKEIIDLNQLVMSYNLIRNNKPISFKQFSYLLKKNKILHQREWRRKLIVKIYRLLDAHNICRADIIRKIADKIGLKIAVINGIWGLNSTPKKISYKIIIAV